MYQVSFLREGKNVSVPEGMTILEAEILAGFRPDAPCGGAGRCGKCLVRVMGTPSEEYPVRACQTKVMADICVDTMGTKEKKHTILTEGYLHPVTYHPGLSQQKIILEKPAAGDKRSDWGRMLAQLSQGEQIHPDTVIASSLYERREIADEWYAVCTEDELLDLRRKPGQICFAAFDIGTTTVVGYLLDAKDGRTLAVESRLNPQVQYGADVILRANYALEHGVEVLSGCIRKTVNEILQMLAEKAGVSPADIYQVSIVGNTCMHHLFLGISPASLVHAPYTPAISRSLTLRAADYGLQIHPKAQLLMLPVIAGFVGSDTSACLMAVRPDQKEEITLLLDIGTNGEMVLGNRRRLLACSTAAGPALEGAKITCGMRGAAGAVDHVYFKDGVWSYTTIDGEPAIGLCGSGLIDLTACLIRAGKIDENGRLESGQENPQTFVLVPPEDSGNGRGVYLTRKDIGEVQLAKAAIAAGIQLLMKELQITEDDVAEVCIAGAFGSYMNPESAGEIGLLPHSMTGRVRVVGNAAGEGAKLALISQEERKAADELARKTEFVELAALPEFQDFFVEQLVF